MQKRMDKKAIFMGLLTFIMAVMLSACGKEESEAIPEKGFGIDYSEDLAVMLPEQVICGQGSAWAITPAKGDFIYKLAFNSGTSGLEEIEWQPEEGEYFVVNIAERSGTLYAEIQNKEEDTIEIRKRRADGGWNDVMSIKPEDKESYTIVGSGFFVDGYENVYLVNGDMVTRFDESGKQICEYEPGGSICFFQENEEGYVECVTARANELTLYELIENRAEEKWTLKVSAGQARRISSSEEGTMCLATDTELLFLDRETGSPSARIDLVKLGVSGLMAGYYDAEQGMLRLYGSAGNGVDFLRCSLLSSRDSFAEQRTELVYGVIEKVNADSSSSIRTAINAFNRENKNYYITIRDYNGNLERMHADMAAGNGPDIIDMMYSEYYESYVKNGYLEDLSPYLEQSRYRDDIVWNVLDAYRIDDGLYLFVPQFRLEGLMLHPDYEAFVEEWNMETFLELIEKNQWDKDIFRGSMGDPESLLHYMMCGRQEEFIDWEQETVAFETEEFMDMLALCREYAQADWSDEAEMTYEEREWNALCSISIFAGGFSSYLSHVDIYGREYPIYGYPTLSGQTYGIIACADSCAIYAGSKQKDGAWEFIESLLLESNQKYRGIANPGFPIRSSVLKEMAEEGMTIRSNGVEMAMTADEILILEDIIYNRELSRVLIDPDIWAVVREETASYFAGDKSAQEAAHIIQSRVRIILQE